MNNVTLTPYGHVLDTGRGAVVYSAPAEPREIVSPGLIAWVTLKEVRRRTPAGGLPTETDSGGKPMVNVEASWLPSEPQCLPSELPSCLSRMARMTDLQIFRSPGVLGLPGSARGTVGERTPTQTEPETTDPYYR